MTAAAANVRGMWRRAPSWRRLLLVLCITLCALVQLGGSRAAVTNATLGAWSDPVAWPIVAVHMSLEPNGRVFALDGFGAAVNSERLWDPATNTFVSVPYGRNLFCAGHIQLADGRTFIAGGHINANEGLADTTIFNAETNTYFRGPDMSVGRWYPTVTQLPDGRVLTFAGDNIVQDRAGADPPFSDASVSSLPSVYDPKTNAWTDLTSARLTSPLYPYMFVMSDGRVFNAGPDTTTRILDPGSWTWSSTAVSPFDGGSAVMYRPNRVMKSGAWADPDFSGDRLFQSHARTAVIDLGSGTPAWRETAPMANPRSYHNLTLLPDGTVLASGGGSQSDGTDLSKSVLPAEIWNPDTETWTTVDSLTNGRLYHSTALLLPDGRVLMAGGGALPGRAADQRNAEIYSPPYLFKGARPTITSTPSTVAWGTSFDVNTPDAGQIQRVSLVRLPSVTHAIDMNQRFQFLTFTAGAGKLTVDAPANANLAPPGDYMLFVLNGNGVPSVASIVRLSAANDTTAPTAPASLGASASGNTVTLAWTSSADASGVTRYNVHRSTTAGFTPAAGNRIAQPTTNSYADANATPGTYYYRVTAEDPAGNVSPASNEASATVASDAPAPGLVAAYSFDAGAGLTLTDTSGHGNTGTLSGPTWTTAGRHGGALSFDGVNDLVSIPDADSLDLTGGMTLEAWVRPTVLGGGWRTAIMKEQPGSVAYSLYANGGDGGVKAPTGEIFSGGYRVVSGPAALALNTWSHIATTYDSSAIRVFVNGAQVAQLPFTGPIATSTSPLRIGGNNVWPEWFAGEIDDVRIYDRALTATQLQSDMNNPAGVADTAAPSAPGTLTATAGLGHVALAWGAATDNTTVARYNVHRSTTPAFAPAAANRIAQPTSTSYTDATGAPGTTYYYKVTAEDPAANVGPPGNEASAAPLADTTPPTAPGGLSATATSGQVALSWSASTDAGGVARYNVHRSTTAGFTPSAANRVAQPTGTAYNDGAVTGGATYYYRVTAEDSAANVSAASNQATATVPVGPPPGLVLALGFDEGTGLTTVDRSGNGNNGTLGGATWATGGRYGGALSFDGSNDLVTVADANTLDLTTGMTLEAWVNPTALGGQWRTTLMKEQPGGVTYSLYANGGDGGPKAPTAELYIGGFRLATSPTSLATNAWAHIATTYDGTTLRVFLNGTQVAATAVSGPIPISASPLRIGGNTIWSEWFAGLIDEVRVYSRALNATEIQADMAAPIIPADSTPPGAPGTLTATGGLSAAQLSWGQATDNSAVTRYNVHRSTTSGFTPSAANRVAQVNAPSTTHADTVPSGGTYYYRVTAEDAAGNVGPPSNESSALVGDSAPPGAPGTLVASGSIGQASLTWGAAADNVGVARYNVHRSTTASFAASAANRVAQVNAPTTTYAEPLAAGTYYYKVTAEDAAGNVGSPTNEAQANVTSDTTPPSTPGNPNAGVSGSSVTLSWSASTDNVGVAHYNVHRSTTSGFAPTAANRIAQPGATSYTDSGLATGTYYYVVTAEDTAGNVSAPTAQLTGTIADATAPTAPSGLAASVAGATVSLSWSAASDNISVARYNVHRGTTSGFAPSPANRLAQPTGTTYSDAGVAPGTYFYKVTAEDAAGNIGPVSNTVTATITDSVAPSAPTTLTATGGAGQASLTWSASTDNVGVTRYNVHRSTVAGFIPSAANRIAQPTTTSYVDNVGAGTYFYRVAAEDAAGNLSAPSPEAIGTVSAPSVTGLVAAYGFDAGAGTVANDQSGNGNNGTIANAAWAGTTAGRFGNALDFNGSNAMVTVADAASLDLTTGMTIEAWVRPDAVGGFQTVIVKERPGDLVYGLYSSSDSNRPQSQVTVGSVRIVDGTASIPAATWTHLAATFDGTTQRLYVNGALQASLTSAGGIMTSTSPVRIGGNSIWSEWFDGLIDEVRIYSRALGAAEIQADMNSSITSPDGTPPSAPGTLTATGSLGQVALAWGTATDNVGVARYNVHRSTSPSFTPAVANRVAQPTGTTYADGVSAGTYYYRVVAEDAAGNTGPASNEASATATADTTPPTVAVSAPSGGAVVAATVNISATASDNGTVGGVQFKVDGVNVGAEDTTAPYTVAWDTFSSGNGPHTITAVARDGAGNATTSAAVNVTVQNTASAGLQGAWAFDEGTGTTTSDQSGRGNTGTISGATWVGTGRYNNALSFNGTTVAVADAPSLDLTTGMTASLWVRPSVAGGWRTAVVKEQPGNLVYGIYANNNNNRPSAEIHVGGTIRVVQGTAALPTLAWSHLAATYDGTTFRLFVNGSQVAQLAVSGPITTSNSPVRIGGNAIWGEHFNGLIDEVRIYNRALAAGEIQSDMNRSITPDLTPPTITARTPTPDAAGINVGTSPTARFSESIAAASITTSTFQLRDAANAVVPATVAYDAATTTATLTPQAALAYGTTYTVTVKGGSGGVADLAGNPLASDATWSFSTEASPPPILVVGAVGNPFGSYLGEILRAEGINAFTTVDIAFLSPALLTQFDVVVLGQTTLSGAQVTTLGNWVAAGGNLLAMRPDKQLAGLLGLTDAGSTLANGYLQVDPAGEGGGVVGAPIQYHGTADRYTLNGATAVATLFSNATTATANPAVTVRAVGTSGGQAAAFTYDLARSVVYTRQGNPAWAGQERDGVSGIRPDDMFFGARAGDLQADWVDTNKIAIPQADEQQRLLANLITRMVRDRLPLPRFWYLPRGEKAVILMSGDDHSPSQAAGGTIANFEGFKALSPPGCSITNWECVRATSYVYPNSNITNAQAATYAAEGFEVALHPNAGSCPTTPISQAELASVYDTQLSSWRTKYTSVPVPTSSRTHCVFWPDWASNAKVELANGIRLDANYYHYPGSWIGPRNGFMNGGGFPMRFADLDGTTIDVYQANTNVTDETTTDYQGAITTLLDNALGATGYYGAFGMNMHTDNPALHSGADAIVRAAQARGVPTISYRQMLEWVDGRNSSTIRGVTWSGSALTFVTTIGSGATGLQTMLPVQGPSGTLASVTCNGTPRPHTTQSIKGIQYAVLEAVTGTCRATYS